MTQLQLKQTTAIGIALLVIAAILPGAWRSVPGLLGGLLVPVALAAVALQRRLAAELAAAVALGTLVVFALWALIFLALLWLGVDGNQVVAAVVGAVLVGLAFWAAIAEPRRTPGQLQP